MESSRGVKRRRDQTTLGDPATSRSPARSRSPRQLRSNQTSSVRSRGVRRGRTRARGASGTVRPDHGTLSAPGSQGSASGVFNSPSITRGRGTLRGNLRGMIRCTRLRQSPTTEPRPDDLSEIREAEDDVIPHHHSSVGSSSSFPQNISATNDLMTDDEDIKVKMLCLESTVDELAKEKSKLNSQVMKLEEYLVQQHNSNRGLSLLVDRLQEKCQKLEAEVQSLEVVKAEFLAPSYSKMHKGVRGPVSTSDQLPTEYIGLASSFGEVLEKWY